MAKNEAMSFYTSGIQAIKARENPFRISDDTADSDRQISLKRSPAAVKSDRILYICAAACIMCVTVAAIAFVLGKSINITKDTSSVALHEGSDTSITVTQPTVTTTEPMIVTSESSAITTTSSETSSETSSTAEVPKQDFKQVDDAIKAYRAYEDEIQNVLDAFQIERLREDFSSQEQKEYQQKLEYYSQLKHTAADWINKNSKEDIEILDIRRVSNDDTTSRLDILNRYQKDLTLKDGDHNLIIISNNTDKSHVSAKFNYTKMIEQLEYGEVTTVYIKTNFKLFESGRFNNNEKSEIKEGDILTADLIYYTTSKDGSLTSFRSTIQFDPNKFVMNEQAEEKLYTKGNRPHYDLTVI